MTLIITPGYWFADEPANWTPMKLPSGYELATYEPNSNVRARNAKSRYMTHSGDFYLATLIEDVTSFALGRQREEHHPR